MGTSNGERGEHKVYEIGPIYSNEGHEQKFRYAMIRLDGHRRKMFLKDFSVECSTSPL